MKIGILQSGHSPKEILGEAGNYADLFVKFLDGQDFTFVAFSVVDMQFPTSATDCDGWLITGSKHGAYEDLAFIAPLEDLVREIYAADIPLVGICFGHQIIAQALGGKVEKFKDGWAVGRQTYDWQGEVVHLNAWHQDQVTVPPKDATVCASNDFCENAALVYGQKAFTVQAHPEFNGDFIDGLAKYRGPGVVPDTLLDAARANINAPVDNLRLAQQIGAFFKERSRA